MLALADPYTRRRKFLLNDWVWKTCFFKRKSHVLAICWFVNSRIRVKEPLYVRCFFFYFEGLVIINWPYRKYLISVVQCFQKPVWFCFCKENFILFIFKVTNLYITQAKFRLNIRPGRFWNHGIALNLIVEIWRDK